MIPINDLRIDPASLGHRFWCVGVVPAYEYKNGIKTDNVVGHKYLIALPEKNLEKIGVRIDGPQQLDEPDGYVEVAFDDLTIKPYVMNGKVGISYRAAGIHAVNAKA